MTDLQTMRVGVLCRRLDVSYRHVRYVLEEDILPSGVEQAPARGHHRQLTAAQAFWLGMVLKLKASGFATPRAALIAGIAERLLTQSDTRRYDADFAPFAGHLRPKLTWYFELGDLRWYRILAEREKPLKRVVEGSWHTVDAEFTETDRTPVVSVRLDLTRLARLLWPE